MKESEEKRIDELFRTGLVGQDLPFDEDHWIDMQNRLTGSSKRKYFFRGLALGGAAAIFLVLAGLWFFQPDETNNGVKIGKSVNKNTGAETSTAKITGNTGQPQMPEVQRAGSPRKPGTGLARPQERTRSRSLLALERSRMENQAAEAPAAGDTEVAINRPLPGSAEYTTASFAGLSTAQLSPSPAAPEAPAAAIAIPEPPDRRPAFNRSVRLGFTAAPDFNAVNQLNKGKAGFSGGLTASLALSRTVSMTTGAILAHKIYDADYKYYHPEGAYKSLVASDVNASCRVLDVPLNINYAVLDKGSNRLQLTAGASSYFMLSEDYIINYSTPKAPFSYRIKNQNRHYFGIANLALSYEKRISKVASIAVQPYVKLPLTDIGYGNVRLFSSGVAASIIMDVASSGRLKTH